MALWDNQYPYTDFHEMNLDYVLTIAEEMKTTIQQLQAALGRIETTETNVDQLQGDVAALQDSVMRLNTTLIQQGERIGTAEGNINSLNTVVASLRADILTLQGLINNTISPQIDVLSGRVTVNETHIAALEEAVSSIQYDVDQINSGFATAKYRDVQQDAINEIVYPYNIFKAADPQETNGTLTTVNGWYQNAQIDSTTGEVIYSGQVSGQYVSVTRLMPVYNYKRIWFKSGPGQNLHSMRTLAFYDGDVNLIMYKGTTTTETVGIAVPVNAVWMRAQYRHAGMNYLTASITFCADNTVGTTYEPYHDPYSGLREAINTYVTDQGQLNNDMLLNLVQIFKKVTGVGDSIMAGFMNRNGVSAGSDVAKAAGNNWISYIGMRTGCTITNLAVGGASSHDWRVTHLNSANIDTDAYFVMLGTNDLRDNLTIGTSADINSTDKTLNADTFYGNMDYIINALRTFKPNAHVIVLTVPAVVQSGTGGYGRDVAPINTALRYICGLYSDHVHLIDLDAYATDFDRAIVRGNYSIGHFDPIAYNYMSAIIERAINRYMYDNQSRFPTAPYA